MGFILQQFSGVFKIRDAAGQPYVLIGGQAVNYWAERYLPCEPELKPLQPFTSEDIDFHGGREDVERIAQQLSLKPAYPPKWAMTALSGIIPLQIGDLKSFNEVLKPTATKRARKIGDRHQIHWTEILPLTAIAASPNDRIRRFQALQMGRGNTGRIG